MAEPDEINAIIKACQKRDRSAQKALYELFAPRMLGVCLRYAHDRETAEDFLQDGFIKIFEKIDKFRFEGAFEGWMRRLMVNMILESYRKAGITTTFTDEFPEPDPEEETISGLPEEEQITLNQLLDLIQQLPERYRLVFNLYVLEELSHEEIATQLNISVGTSKSNLSRARKWLQQRLNEKRK